MGEFQVDKVPLEGVRLVEAGAGTGKTWTLVRLHQRLLLEKRIPLEKILVVTFTNAATAELKSRIREGLRELLREGSADRSLLEKALRDFDRAPVTTIHGFCHRVLQEEAFQSGIPFDVPLSGEAASGITEKTRDFWVEKTFHDEEGEILDLAPGPEALLPVAREVQNRPDLEPLPGVEVSGRGREAWERVEARLEEARRAWKEGKEEVIRIFLEGGLSGKFYQARWVPGWVEKLEAYLEKGGDFRLFREPGKNKIAWAEKFSSSRIARAAGKGSVPPEHPFFRAWDRFLEACKDPDLPFRPPDQLEVLREFVERIRSRPGDPALLLREGFTFADVLLFVRRALEGPGGDALAAALRERFRAALVDEFQDTDPIQYAIFRKVFASSKAPLFLVGDPKQAIYSFRGGDVFTYRSAREDAGGEPETLSRNWRSDPSLVEALNGLFGGREEPFGFDWIPFREARAQVGEDRLFLEGNAASGLYLLCMNSEGRPLSKERAVEAAAREGAAWLASFLGKGPGVVEEGGERTLGPGDAAVLVRTNSQAARMVRALARVGLPSVLLGTASVFDSAEAEEVERLLRALVEPTRRRAVLAALATGILGRRASDLVRLREDQEAWEAEVERFARWKREAAERGFLAVYLEILSQGDVLQSVLGERAGERRLTNLRHLGELLDRAARERHLGLPGLLSWLGRMRREKSFRGEVGSEAEQVRLETDEAAVKVITVHRSKGLEFPLVLCPFTWDEPAGPGGGPRRAFFHERVKPFRGFLDLGSAGLEENERLAGEEREAEARRLFYVALTRAKFLAALVLGGVKGLDRSSPGILLGVEEKDLEGGGLPEKLARFSERSKGRVVVEILPGAEAGPPCGEEGKEPPLLEGNPLRRVLDASRRVSSFSGLVSGEGRLLPAGMERPGAEPGEGEREGLPAWGPPEEGILLQDFPAGPGAGNFFHHVLERMDFRDRAGWEEIVGKALVEHGFGPEWKEKVLPALEMVVETPLEEGGPRLREISPRERLTEMEFLFPCGRGEEKVTAARLAAALEAAGGPFPGDYPERVAALGFRPLRGFLRGFVDLAFQWEGRWYLADYKTNHLGPLPGDYREEKLVRAMGEHHYFLQYHIYTAALHLYLRKRVEGYDFEEHFGGVYYLFLRGMGGRDAGPRGVFRDRPSRDALEAFLDALGVEGGMR